MQAIKLCAMQVYISPFRHEKKDALSNAKN